MNKKFTVYGYDKDNGVYEEVCQAPTEERAGLIASMLAEAQHKGDRMRSSLGDPFDWFAIDDGCGTITTAFTHDEPGGLPVKP